MLGDTTVSKKLGNNLHRVGRLVVNQKIKGFAMRLTLSYAPILYFLLGMTGRPFPGTPFAREMQKNFRLFCCVGARSAAISNLTSCRAER